MFNRNDTLVGEFFDVVLSVLLPVIDVWVSSYSEWSTGEDDGTDVVIEASGLDGFFVRFRCTGFLDSR